MQKIRYPALAFFNSICIMILVLLGFFTIIGTGTDDYNAITITNLDNHDYYVELRNAEDMLIDSLKVHDFPSFDATDSFSDIEEGNYYIIIYRDNVEYDRTALFHLDDYEYECFTINEHGEIDNC